MTDRDAPAPRIELSGRETENACILWVRDNGIGIGLAIVRKAMQRMGGRVWAESAPGSGATFYLEMPK